MSYPIKRSKESSDYLSDKIPSREEVNRDSLNFDSRWKQILAQNVNKVKHSRSYRVPYSLMSVETYSFGYSNGTAKTL